MCLQAACDTSIAQVWIGWALALQCASLIHRWPPYDTYVRVGFRFFLWRTERLEWGYDIDCTPPAAEKRARNGQGLLFL